MASSEARPPTATDMAWWLSMFHPKLVEQFHAFHANRGGKPRAPLPDHPLTNNCENPAPAATATTTSAPHVTPTASSTATTPASAPNPPTSRDDISESSDSEMETEQRSADENSDDDGFQTVVSGKRKRAARRESSTPSPPPKTQCAPSGTKSPGPSAPSPPPSVASQPPTGAPSQGAPVAGRVKPPPPLFIQDKGKWDSVSRMMAPRGINFTSARTTQSGIKVQVPTPKDHRALTRLLRLENISFHTFALEEEKRLRVVIRGLPKEISSESILADLKRQSYPILECHRMYSGKTRAPYDMVLAILDRTPEGKAIFNVKEIVGLSGLVVEAPYRNGPPGQCHRCQLYGHAARFCYARPRCVKCLGDHGTADCARTKDSREPPSCVLCGNQGHTANYRGCPKAPRYANRGTSRPAPHTRPLNTRAQPIGIRTTAVPQVSPLHTPAPAPSYNAWSKPLSLGQSRPPPAEIRPTVAQTCPSVPPAAPRAPAPYRAPGPYRAPAPLTALKPAKPVSLAQTNLAADLALVMDYAMAIDMDEVSVLAHKLRSATNPNARLQATLEHASILSTIRSYSISNSIRHQDG